MAKKYKLEDSAGLDVDSGSPPVTIVGGQARRGLHQEVRIPVGIERALYLAAKDPEFRVRLLKKRAAAARAEGLALTETEETVLDRQPEKALRAAIERLSPEDHGRRRFMKAVAASFVSVAAGTAGEGCVNCDCIDHDAGVHISVDGCVPDVRYSEDAEPQHDGPEPDAPVLNDGGDPDAGADGGADGGPDGGSDGGPDGGADGGPDGGSDASIQQPDGATDGTP